MSNLNLDDILAQFNAQINNLTEQLQIAQADNRELRDTQEQLVAQIASLNVANNASNIPTTPNAIKVNKPKEFSGKREETKSFLGQCQLVFDTQPALYGSETLKIRYAASFLRDTAFRWYLTLVDQRRLPNTYAAFTLQLSTAFGETDMEAQAKRAIAKLRQKGSCADYTTEFNRLASNTRYNDAAKVDLYKQGLKEEVKDLMLTLLIFSITL